MDILSKIKEANLGGCGGACFPTADKWQAVRNSFAVKKYVICNGSEGEPNVFKDGYILGKYPEKVIEGMKIAIKLLSERGVKVGGYIFLNHEYAKRYGNNLKKIIAAKKAAIDIFVKPKNGGYICGEETTILNVVEGKKAEPRLKPPFPTTSGLFGYPTIVNNVETFFQASEIESGVYKGRRFFSVNGDCTHPGVYELPATESIEGVLRKTDNFPLYKFFVQVGGGASGEIINDRQLNRPASGAMSLTVYRADKWQARELLRKWIGFFLTESCGQCTPCREGNYRLFEVINSKKPDWELFFDLLDNLAESSFCGLGFSVPIPIRSYIKNILLDKRMGAKDFDKKNIVKYFQ